MPDKISHFKDLIAWKKAHLVVIDIYKVTKSFPKEELFSLTNQIQRSAVSITSNIAEGFGRNTAKDKNQFYAISKGSALELESQLEIAKDLNYLDKKTHANMVEKIVEIEKIISGLMRTSFNR